MLNPLCGLELWPWPWNFKVKFWNGPIPGTGWPIDMEWKGMWVDMLLDPLCYLDLRPHQWLSTWSFKVKFSNSHISGMWGPIDMWRKECLSDTTLDPQARQQNYIRLISIRHRPLYRTYIWMPIGPISECRYHSDIKMWYLPRLCRCRNQISNRHWMVDVVSATDGGGVGWMGGCDVGVAGGVGVFL